MKKSQIESNCLDSYSMSGQNPSTNHSRIMDSL